MQEGMLWVDTDPKVNTETKVREAAIYFQKKYGKKPNTCYVYPAVYAFVKVIDEITLRPDKGTRPNNFFIGVEDTGPERSEKKKESAFAGNPALNL